MKHICHLHTSNTYVIYHQIHIFLFLTLNTAACSAEETALEPKICGLCGVRVDRIYEYKPLKTIFKTLRRVRFLTIVVFTEEASDK